MELALTIVAALGVLLFLIGYLAFVIAGFRHHFVTGIISVLPILNIVTVPALWHKTSKKLMIGFLGVLLFAGSWFLGADANIKKLFFHSKNTRLQTTTGMMQSQEDLARSRLSTSASATSIAQSQQVVGSTIIRQSNDQESVSEPFNNQRYPIDESDMQALPPKALYKLSFEAIPTDNINTLKGRIIKILNNNHESYEGRVTKVSSSSIFMRSVGTIGVENEFPIVNIKQLYLMVKKGN